MPPHLGCAAEDERRTSSRPHHACNFESVSTGVPLSTATWFILRMPHSELSCEARPTRVMSPVRSLAYTCAPSCRRVRMKDRVKVSRVQRRLIHILSQAIEQNLETRLVANVPAPSSCDCFHPARVNLVCIRKFSYCAVVTYLSPHIRCFLLVSSAPRDGRKQMREVKVKHVLHLNRFLSRSSGFVSAHAEAATLADLGLEDICPSHTHRHRKLVHACLPELIMLHAR